MKVGIIGCGVVADYGHAPAIRSTEGLTIGGAYDPDQAVMAAFCKRHEVPGFASLDAMLDSGIDTVAICSPPEAHGANAIAASLRRLPILCEKPIAQTEADALDMIAEVRRNETPITVGFVYRYSPVAQTIHKIIREGLIGEPRSLRLIYLWDLHGQWMADPNGKWVESPRWRGRMLEGGPMVDCGVHQIDLARWWLGKEIVHTAGAGAWVSNYEAPDHVTLHLDHEGGCHTMVEISFTYGHTARETRSVFQYEIIGTGGVLRFDREGWILEVRNGEGTTRYPGASEKDFPGMYAAFRDAFASGDFSEMPTVEDGLIATRIARTATDHLIEQRKRLLSATPV